MGLENEGKIVSAKHKFYISSEPADQTEAIDTLAAYGEQAVSASCGCLVCINNNPTVHLSSTIGTTNIEQKNIRISLNSVNLL